MQNGELMLDQLWFTWSTNGLGSMPMGFRVRAASERFYDIQGMDYRQVNRFVEYKLPQGVSASEFSPNIAPASLTLVDNGNERLLIRKIYTGLDAVGRNGNFFTHLIAGLPHEFSARDAIRLWYCPSLWVESEEGKAAHDKTLEKIPYSKVRYYAENPQASFNVGPISEPLQNLLLLILTRGLPPHILMRGHSNMIAPLIYGLTHALPMKLLPGLTFTTYESTVQEIETLIAGTLNGSELQDITKLQVQPGQTTGPVPPDLQRYVLTAYNALLAGHGIEKFTSVINEIDRRDQPTVEDLIGLFKWRFRVEPLNVKRLEDIVLHPADNLDDLSDPAFQQEAAQLLLNQPDYWERQGKQVFQRVVSWLTSGAQSRLNQRTLEVLARFVNGVVEYIYATIRTKLSQLILPQQEAAVLIVLAYDYGIYLRMLTEFTQEPIYGKIKTDTLWGFQLWLLSCAKSMKTPPTWEQILPWLHISAWDKLEQVLKLDLPADWEYYAIVELLSTSREIGKGAYALAKKYEAKFTRTMQSLLIQGSQAGNQEWINTALRLFAAIIQYEEQDHSYRNRAGLLLALLNAVPTNSRIIESLFAIVPATSPYQLTIEEFDRVVAGCHPEVLKAGGTAPSLMKYLLEYVLSLTPKKLNVNTIRLLEQFQSAATTLPKATANLVNSWLTLNAFLANQNFDDKKLRAIEPALAALVPELKERGQDIWQIFIEELAPYLITLIEDEYQLGSVLAVFDGAYIVQKWDLLNALATRVAEKYTESTYRIFPYVIVGIREHACSGLQKNLLDIYLKTLLGRISDSSFNDVDNALKAKVWAELIQTEWKGWRERNRPSIVEKIRSRLPQQQNAQGDPLVDRGQPAPVSRPPNPTNVAPDHRNIPLQNQPPMVGQPVKEQAPLILKQPQIKISTPEKAAFAFHFSIDGEDRSYYDSAYQQAYRTLAEVLPFWQKTLQANKTKDRADSIAFEEKTLNSLLEELKRQPLPAYSRNLAQYLVDNKFIQTEVEQLCASGDQTVNESLDPEKFIATVLQGFQVFAGDNRYYSLFQSLGEAPMKKTFTDLIRRNQLILLMINDKENYKGGWKKWLEQQRKRTKIQEARRG